MGYKQIRNMIIDMRRQINNIISVLHSFFRFGLLKVFNYKGVKIHLIQRFSPNVEVEVNRGGRLVLGKTVRVHSGSKIKVRRNAILEMDDDVMVNYNCIFVCRKAIHIGKGTEFGPGVYIYDHDHDFKEGLKADKFVTDEVIIGENCWIGAGCIILKGTHIGDNCVVGAGSVVKGTMPANSILYQKRDSQIVTIDSQKNESC